MKIIISDMADDDLLQLFSYLFRQSPRAAETISDAIDRCFANLSSFPFSGSPRHRLGPDIRGVAVPPYVVLYAVRRDHITILRILHGSRNIDQEFSR